MTPPIVVLDFDGVLDEIVTPPVVVLDLDGVLNDTAFLRTATAGHTSLATLRPIAHTMLDPMRVARLQRVCDATGAAIAVCSGWRRSFAAEELADILARVGLTAPVLGVVGGLRMSGETRMDGIAEWLVEHEVSRFVVLDDEVNHYLDFACYPDDTASEGWTETWVTHGGRQCRAFVPSWLVDRLVVPADGLTDADTDTAIAALAIDRRVTR